MRLEREQFPLWNDHASPTNFQMGALSLGTVIAVVSSPQLTKLLQKNNKNQIIDSLLIHEIRVCVPAKKYDLQLRTHCLHVYIYENRMRNFQTVKYVKFKVKSIIWQISRVPHFRLEG